MGITSVRINAELETPLIELAKQLRRSKGWIINEALRTYIQKEKRWQETLEGLEDIRMGRVVDGEKVRAWLESWGTKDELPCPLEENGKESR